jgi:hypothetical protein
MRNRAVKDADDRLVYVIDLSADSLRRDAERQREIHRLMVG